jgi:uncharacterized membrane protein YhaH (DUF805 family)
MNYYTKVISKYAEFSGRARRAEYWMFGLINIIIMLSLAFIGVLLDPSGSGGGLVIYFLYFLFMFIPSIAVTIRRLHDTGNSGWMVLVAFIPFIGPLWIFILMCIEGEAQENKYGLNPKATSYQY